ncbi:putative calreticulin [Leptomonas pyrrhocoris]|uniref:Calreticulin n=1 Tax=Leptomonas pyrrhocoris TaxID=157538 RepID=A0A0M9FRN3_LEPPY|nr:putative calreticulin [Leptomonas pyrrhocoris]XP_015652914.1 putative calreticulin [Leptomonas pyrrhocoris]XP_015652915.1 putative calreticulin [Leptomonas pyrrhocoris]KPA74474.1 putative calreticulin [Leptomonas pyrrhocoris]KPA74475.1 putative calreticulin [Leptomonas pyrrhocoris]KPA74476.1 putative calreticulin [Leptomonas pyrrhocoris]|eukprot:XP_015652913.1 putative calreticulin [Leptomonas pyrrhocoris]
MSRRTVLAALVGVLLLCVCVVRAEVFFHEEFNSLDGWVQSEHRSDYGKVKLSAGAMHVDAKKEQGLQLSEDAKFYAISTKLPTPVSNDGKNLVISFSVKHDQKLECGGAYLKFFSELDQKDFNGESPYWLMFGPDTCGATNRLHIILNHDGENYLWKSNSMPAKDKATHVYTLEIAANNTYQLYMDGSYKKSGSLEEEWEIVAPKTIPDPDEQKPADWVDDSMMDDPEDTKPADWDNEPATIVDPEAVKPEDWDDAEDGEWEAPQIPNPAYRGPWTARQIKNPAYKGVWEPKQIPNPKYVPMPNLYKVPAPLQYVGIDVWQVQGGSIFNNIILGDDLQEVLKLVQATYGAIAEKERQLIEAAAEKQKEENAKATAAAKAKIAEEKDEVSAEETEAASPEGDDDEDL